VGGWVIGRPGIARAAARDTEDLLKILGIAVKGSGGKENAEAERAHTGNPRARRQRT
jgi:hypothetical protein